MLPRLTGYYYSFLRHTVTSRDNNTAPNPQGPNIAGDLMAQYFVHVLGSLGRGPGLPGAFGLPGTGGGSGRWGDYVFTQEGQSLLLFFYSDLHVKLILSSGSS